MPVELWITADNATGGSWVPHVPVSSWPLPLRRSCSPRWPEPLGASRRTGQQKQPAGAARQSSRAARVRLVAPHASCRGQQRAEICVWLATSHGAVSKHGNGDVAALLRTLGRFGCRLRGLNMCPTQAREYGNGVKLKRDG